MRTLKTLFVCLALLAVCLDGARAEVSLPAFFSDNMVLQRHATPLLWGTAAAGKTVEVSTSWNGKTHRTTADRDGNWKLRVETSEHGGPYSIRVGEGNTVLLENVLIGDVWVCSGQSNMEMPLAGWGEVDDYENETARANYPGIRLLHVERAMAEMPAGDAIVRNGRWDVCSPTNIADFSAVAYFFAREVHEKTNIPIGLIHASWGGTVAEAWMDMEALRPFPDLYTEAKAVSEGEDSPEWEQAQEKYAQWLENALQRESKDRNGRPLWAADTDTKDWPQMVLPGFWEKNGLPDFDGVVWFRKKIVLDKSWTEGEMQLNFAADDEDVTWFNGHRIGATSGWDVRREYRVPKELVREGENTIAVRVFDNGGGGGIHTQALQLKSEDGRVLDLSGHWDYKIGAEVGEIMQQPQKNKGPKRPTVLYNAMIHPFRDYAAKGAIWYQGESNAQRAVQYRTLFPALISNWRRVFGKPDMPFYFVQLANFRQRDSVPMDSGWQMLREAQAMAAKLPNTGMATAIDLGDARDIHPKNKQDVGRRLALWALAKDYGRDMAFSGPEFQSHNVEGNGIRIRFAHAKGLKTKDNGSVKGFAVAGADRKFYWATAEITGDGVIVRAPEVSRPVAVRYAWANNPDCNLYNAADLPALPFRTDDW